MMNIGKLKAIADRELGYIGRLNFVMIAYLFIKDVGFHWWYLLVIPVFLIWIWIDLKYIMPKEFDYLHNKSPLFTKLLKNTEK